MEFNEWFKDHPGKPDVDKHVGLVLFARKWAAAGWNAHAAIAAKKPDKTDALESCKGCRRAGHGSAICPTCKRFAGECDDWYEAIKK